MGILFRTVLKNSTYTSGNFSDASKKYMSSLDPKLQLKIIRKVATSVYRESLRNQKNALMSSGIKSRTGTLKKSFKLISEFGKQYPNSVFVWLGIPRGKKDTQRPYWGGNPRHVQGFKKRREGYVYSKSMASMYAVMLDGGALDKQGRQRIKAHNFIIKADSNLSVTRNMLDVFNKALEQELFKRSQKI